MPRINSPPKSRTALLHGREQTPFGSQTPFSSKGRRTTGHSARKPDTSVSLLGCQGTKKQKSPFILFVLAPRFKLQLLQFVTPKRRPPLTPPFPGETIVQGISHATCPLF